MTTTPNTPAAIVTTGSGLAFPLLAPKASHIRLDDIVLALGSIARYAGNRAIPWPVAGHSILVADLLDPAAVRAEPLLPVAALLHDAAEAYMGDVPSPLKALLPDFSRIEDGILAAVSDATGIPVLLFRHPALLAADREALRFEAGAEQMALRDILEGDSEARAGMSPETLEEVRACLRDPQDWGFASWPDEGEIMQRGPIVVNTAFAAAGYARVRLLLRLESEARRLESTRPGVAATLSGMLSEPKHRAALFNRASPQRVVALSECTLPAAASLRAGVTDATHAIIECASGSITPGRAKKAIGSLMDALGHAATLSAMGIENTQPLSPADEVLVKEDPARFITERANEAYLARRATMAGLSVPPGAVRH